MNFPALFISVVCGLRTTVLERMVTWPGTQLIVTCKSTASGTLCSSSSLLTHNLPRTPSPASSGSLPWPAQVDTLFALTATASHVSAVSSPQLLLTPVDSCLICHCMPWDWHKWASVNTEWMNESKSPQGCCIFLLLSLGDAALSWTGVTLWDPIEYVSTSSKLFSHGYSSWRGWINICFFRRTCVPWPKRLYLSNNLFFSP